MSINCLIVDDEPEAIEVIATYLKALPGFRLTGTALNALDAFKQLQQNRVDLMFLDINMPKMNGFKLLESLSIRPKVIITTAYREYAADGFDMEVLDFLLKPISMERFLKAVSKIYRIENPELLNNFQSEPVSYENPPFIYLKSERKMIKIFLSDICYIESVKDYVKVYTTERTILAKQRISFLEKMLPEDHFVRIHRSFIVATSKVEAFTQSTIEVLGKELPIGKMFRPHTLKVLKISR